MIYPARSRQVGQIGNPMQFPSHYLGAVAAETRSYPQILVEDFGASEVWPLVNIGSGTTIPAYVNSARNGTLTGWGLQNAAGPVPGTLAPYSDGANDYGDIYSSNGSNGLVDIWNGQVFSIVVWGKADNWTGTTARRMIDIRADSSNLFLLDRQTGSTLRAQYRANGTTKTVTLNSGDPAGWFSFGFSVNLVADEMKVFFNGSQQGSTQTGLGTWSGTPASSTTLMGSGPAPPSTVWLGLMAYYAFIFGNIWSPANFAAIHAAAATAKPTLRGSLMGYWELGEASGNRADSHGANTLSDVNTVTQATGVIGNAAQFVAANNEALDIVDNASLSTGDIDFTTAGWVYLDTAGATTRSIVAKWTTSGNQREYMLIYQNSRFHWLVSPVGSGAGAIDLVANSFGAPSTATWYYVVGWHDSVNNVVGISVNGVVDTASYSAGVFDGTATFRIGNAGFGGGAMDGRIDQVGFWKRVLTSAERAFLYNSGSGRAYSEL